MKGMGLETLELGAVADKQPEDTGLVGFGLVLL